MGKCRVYNRGGIEPPRVRELGPDVWCGGSDRQAGQRCVMVLRSPVGSTEYIAAHTEDRIREEQRLLEHLPH
eukprot:12184219-Karenia_brevis.AAC.1